MSAFRALLLSAVAVAVVGCGKPSSSSSPSTGPAAAPAIVGALPVPNFIDIGDLGLLLENGGRLKVGDPLDSFVGAFPRPSTAKAVALRELPNTTPAAADPYTVSGWSMLEGNQGAGALVYQGRVALAMVQLEALEEKAVTDQVLAYEKAFGTAVVLTGPRVRYWFWTTSDPQVLMVCAFETAQGRQNLTVCVGDAAVMAVLRMSPDKAAQDLDKLKTPASTSAGRSQ